MALQRRSLPGTPTVRRESTGKSFTLTLMRRSLWGCCQAVSNCSADDFEGKPCTMATISQGRFRFVWNGEMPGNRRTAMEGSTHERKEKERYMSSCSGRTIIVAHGGIVRSLPKRT